MLLLLVFFFIFLSNLPNCYRIGWCRYALRVSHPFSPSTRNCINFWWVKVMAAVSAINYTNHINLDWITTRSQYTLFYCIWYTHLDHTPCHDERVYFCKFPQKKFKTILLTAVATMRQTVNFATTNNNTKKKKSYGSYSWPIFEVFFSLFFLRKAFAVLIAYAVVYILQKHAISLILFVDRIVILEKVSLHLPWIFKSNRRIPRKFSGEKRKTNLFSTRTNAQKEMNVFEWIIKFTYELVWNR